MNPDILKIENLVKSFNGNTVINGISLSIAQGELSAIIGPNGAGKTTTMLSIMGLNRPKSGTITYRGKDITGHAPFKIARAGIGFVPEDRRVFPDLTVLGNLDVGRRTPKNKSKKWTLERIYKLFPRLQEFSHRNAGTLSGGEQQMLTIAGTLMGNPDFLLLDEPSEGLAPIIVKVLGEFIEVIKQEGMTVLLSEQNTKFALKHADRAYIVDNGSIKFEGSIDELEQNAEIKKRYLAV